MVVSPLIALIQDQHDRLAAAGLPVAMVTSLQSGREMHDAIAAIAGGDVRLVLCAPERFAHEAFTRAVRANPVDLLAIEGRLLQIAFLKTAKVELDFSIMMRKRAWITSSWFGLAWIYTMCLHLRDRRLPAHDSAMITGMHS